MPSPSATAHALAERYRLALRETTRNGLAGERLGRGTGASLEFQDRRDYVAGDDVRHLDWGAYARTNKLMVRMYREEILPHIDLLVDGSRSMAVDQDKAQFTTDFVHVISETARSSGFHVRVTLLRAQPEVIERGRFLASGLEFDSSTPLAHALQVGLTTMRPSSIRLLVSDFLSPHDAGSVVKSLAASAGGLQLVQVLGREDRDPPLGKALRLEDAETGAALDLVLDRRTVEGYKLRLERLGAALELECQRAGGRYLSICAVDSLELLCRERLARAGWLVPA
jgi:uncharacterized protein (DUF58 family)